MTESKSSTSGTSRTSLSVLLRAQALAGGEVKSQIVQHSLRFKQTEISDADKIESLETLIILSITLQQNELKEILKVTGIIESVSSLLFGTQNPRIRTLCGAVIQLLLTIAQESKVNVDWQSFVAPLISLLFNEDEQISELGKQTILDSIKKQPLSITSLLDLNIFDKSAQFLESTFSSSPSKQISETQLNIVHNLLEVIQKLIQASPDATLKTKQLKASLNKVKQSNPSRQIKNEIGAILFIIGQEEEDYEAESKITQKELQQSQQQVSQLQEQLRISEQKIIDSEEKARLTEQLNKQQEEQLKQEQLQKEQALQQAQQSDEKAKIAEQWAKIAEERAHASEIAENEDKQKAINAVQQSGTVLVTQIGAISQTQFSSATLTPMAAVASAITKDTSSELDNPDPLGLGVKFERVEGLIRKANALRQEHISLSLNKVITDGIHRVEVRFRKCNTSNGYADAYIGIVKADYVVPFPCNPYMEPHNKYMLYYHGGFGYVYYKGIGTPSNSEFKDGSLIALELNADLGTLHFFVGTVQQPLFVTGIKGAVKFFFWIHEKDSSFQIASVKQLNKATTKTLPNQEALQW
ncbi:MAG: hypothetical protein EZS28_023448 [Streblomastix strix]|uniref:SPRY domain-containing protein n=1 Tax=Streblomastix strix TaxID=222440 RepID=A0A5J4VEY6_9EUKA|nr:MAG: hypothetical protein EZS28_023448 [Streblomastix strix]